MATKVELTGSTVPSPRKILMVRTVEVEAKWSRLARLVVQVWMQKLVKDGMIAVLEHRKKEEMNSCSGFNPLRPLFFLL